MYVLKNVFLSSKNPEKIFARTQWKPCGYSKFETEIHLFVACTKKTKIHTPRSKLQSS
jgi:hypothetical protein